MFPLDLWIQLFRQICGNIRLTGTDKYVRSIVPINVVGTVIRMRYYIRLCSVLCLSCVSYYVACITLVRALVYCTFLREVRLGGWGSEGPKGTTLGQYVSACATIPLGSGRI